MYPSRIRLGLSARRGESCRTSALTDDDTRGVTVSVKSLSLVEGGRGSYGLSLRSQPTQEVSVTATSGDAASVQLLDASVRSATPGNKITLTFTAENWEPGPEPRKYGGVDAYKTGRFHCTLQVQQNRATRTDVMDRTDRWTIIGTGVALAVLQVSLVFWLHSDIGAMRAEQQEDRRIFQEQIIRLTEKDGELGERIARMDSQ